MNKINFIYSNFFLIFNAISYGIIVEIKVKIQDQIITNLDIENEKNYLFFLNPKLRELETSRINNIAKESLITEKIKKIELYKFFDFDSNNDLLNVVEKNLFKKKNIKDKNLFIKIFKQRDLNYEIVKQKLYT